MFKGTKLILALLCHLRVVAENVFALNISETPRIRDGNDMTNGCFGNHSILPLTLQEKENILELHNKYRNLVAEGKERRGSPGPQPPASNMHVLSWNENLELSIQKEINRCNASSGGSRNVGEPEQLFRNQTDAEHIVESWFNQVEYFNQELIQSFPRNVTSTERYTRFVWADSKHIGCVLLKREENLMALICKYFPKGNIYKDPVYEIGFPCSKCPSGTQCSRRYPGLCTGRVAEEGMQIEVYINSTEKLNMQNLNTESSEEIINSGTQLRKRVPRQDIDDIRQEEIMNHHATRNQEGIEVLASKRQGEWDEMGDVEVLEGEDLTQAAPVADHDRLIVGNKKYRKGVWVNGVCTCPTGVRSSSPVVVSSKRIVYAIMYLICVML